MERILKSRLLEWIEKENLISIYQSGFRKNRCTNDNILRMIHDVKIGFTNKEKTGMITFDIRKAFDKVPHNKLIQRLQELNCPDYLISWVYDFLNNRSYTISVNKALSNFIDIDCGVPQGSVLSPILFALYFDKITNCIDKTKKVKIALFADDVVIWITHWNKAAIQSNLSSTSDNQFQQISVVMKRLFIKARQRQSISVSFSEICLQMQADIKNDQRLCSKRNNHFSPLAQYSLT